MLRIASAMLLSSALRPISYLLRDLTPWLVRAAVAWLLAQLRGKAAGGARLPCRSCPFLPPIKDPPASPRVTRGRRSIVPPILAVAFSICVAMAAGGCAPAASYVAAERATYDAIAPDHAAYVNADPTLNDLQKARRLRTLQAWHIRLSHAAADRNHSN